MKKLILPALAFCLGMVQPVLAQQDPAPAAPKNELKYNLSEDGSLYVKATFLNQTWLRWNESNPGTLVNGEPKDHTFDVGLRRSRMQLYGQLTDRVFFYTQFGMNNFNYLSQNAGNRKLQAFFHDVLGEYKVSRHSNMLKLGAGLTIVNGLSWFTQPSIGSIMTTDVPVFLQVTVDQTDEFARKLSVYARGQVGPLDYRFAISDPFPIQTNGQAAPVPGPFANFSTYGHSHQYSGFLMLNILDKEPHTTPYMAGTYLGERSVLNLEGGVIYQNNATTHLETTSAGSRQIFNNMFLWSVAAFADMPIQDNKFAISAYAGYFSTDYGHNYLRMNGIMNPANGNSSVWNFSGPGNAYPMFGTGSSLYTQLGLRLPNDLLGEHGTLLPYASYRHSSYDMLDGAAVNIFDTGINWLINKHMSKLSLNYQLRPVYRVDPAMGILRERYANSTWLQYQISF